MAKSMLVTQIMMMALFRRVVFLFRAGRDTNRNQEKCKNVMGRELQFIAAQVLIEARAAQYCTLHFHENCLAPFASALVRLPRL
jgi:hypothetical protein